MVLARFSGEPVTYAIVRVYVVVRGATAVDLFAYLSHADINSTIAVAIRNAPDASLEFVTCESTPLLAGECHDEAKLCWRQRRIFPVALWLPLVS